MTQPEEARVRLDPDSALVLFELLSRWFDDGGMPTERFFESPAEYAVLSGLRETLQAQLTAPLAPDYLDLLEAARERAGADWLDEFVERRDD